MSIDFIKSITFGNICSIVKKQLDINYLDMAEELHYNYKTFARWKNSQTPYKALSGEQYRSLFKLIEDACKKNNITFAELFVPNFPELKEYKETDEIKRIIAQSLDYHMENFCKSSKTTDVDVSLGSAQFIKDCFTGDKKIKRVDIAAHSAANWLRNDERNELLAELDRQGVEISILINDQRSIQHINGAAADLENNKRYLEFDHAIDQWAGCSVAFKKLSFRVSNYPLLRRIFIVTYTDNTSEAFVRNYAYDFHRQDSRSNLHLGENDFYLEVYKNEFEYLWKNAQSYDEWNSNKRVPDEL